MIEVHKCETRASRHSFDLVMEDDKEILKELDGEQHEEVGPIPPAPPTRKKGFSRAYFGSVSFGMFMFLLLCVIALGSFGAEQAKLSRLVEKDKEFYHGGLCLLFMKTRPNPNTGVVSVLIDTPQSNGPCVFMFWGLTSGTILAFALIIYSLVMLVVASKIVNWLRLVDFLLCFFGFLGFFAFSVTLTAGLNRTCSGYVEAGATCSVSYILSLSSGSRLYFYSSVAAAKNCSWIIAFGLLVFSMWNLILAIVYFRQRIRKRQMASTHRGEFSGTSTLSSPVEQPPPYSQ